MMRDNGGVPKAADLQAGMAAAWQGAGGIDPSRREMIDAAEKTADVESLRSGFRMTAQQLEKLLDSHGCRTIPTDGSAFDPAIHEAILRQPAAGVAAGTVVATASRGYTLHDRVVRPAQVIVAQGD
jgi:molecular chaperone GrpE